MQPPCQHAARHVLQYRLGHTECTLTANCPKEPAGAKANQGEGAKDNLSHIFAQCFVCRTNPSRGFVLHLAHRPSCNTLTVLRVATLHCLFCLPQWPPEHRLAGSSLEEEMKCRGISSLSLFLASSLAVSLRRDCRGACLKEPWRKFCRECSVWSAQRSPPYQYKPF